MIKKVLGIILIALGAFLVLPFLSALLKMPASHRSTSNEIGILTGYIIGQLFTLTLILLFIFLGIRMVKSSARKN